MSKLFQRKGFRLASVAYFLSLGTLAVALFAWFSTSSTFSWFASNKTVDASGMAIKVKTDDEVDIDVKVYKYAQIMNEDVGTGKYQVQEMSLTDSLAMTRYDQVFQDDNHYAPILMKLTLNGGSYSESDDKRLPLVIHHTDETDRVVTIADSTGTETTHTITDDDTQYHLSSYISSVVSVKAMVYNTTISGVGSYDSEPENIFKTMETKFTEEKKPEYKTRFFVTESKENLESTTFTGIAAKADVNFSDDTTKAKTGVDGNLTYKPVSDTDKTCIVYVWIDYDDSTTKYENTDTNYNGLINRYITQMSGSSLGINNSYKIPSDITEISIVSTNLKEA